MRPGAPTRLDRAVLTLVSGPVGHLAATVVDLGPTAVRALMGAAGARLRRVLSR